MDVKKMRNSSIELLRIVSILMIITAHFGVHGVFHVLEESDKGMDLLTADSLNWQICFTQTIGWLGGLGNVLFILITGYYMIGRDVNYRKIFLLIITLFFYSWSIGVFAFGIVGIAYDLIDVIKNLFPLYFGNNWFVSCYIIFSLFLPFINKFLNALSRGGYLYLLLLLFLVNTILPSFKCNTFINGSPLVQFAFIYAVGGYLKLYYGEICGYNKKYMKNALCYFLFCLLSILLFDTLGMFFHNDFLISIAGLNPLIKILTIPLGIYTFLTFLISKPFYDRRINMIGGSVLGIYLIHDNELMRKILWDNIFPNLNFINSDLFLLFCLLKVMAIFCGCCIIDLLRKKYLKSFFCFMLDKSLHIIEVTFYRFSRYINFN